MKYVAAVCDYGDGDLAWLEVKSALRKWLPPGSAIDRVGVHSFATLELGFVVQQLGLSNSDLRPDNLLIFGNCAPRKDRGEARQNNEGEGLLYGLLDTGVPLVVVNSGYSLSFVRDRLKELRKVNVPKGGSQFRSRDIFPKVVGAVAAGDLSLLGDALDPLKVIPEVPHGVVAYVDSFGNLKTTYRVNDPIFQNLAPGTEVKVKIGSIPGTAYFATGSFNVREGQLALAPGSSGHDNRFMELFLRSNSAWRFYGNPSVETPIEITPIQPVVPASA
jgi:hypothetical protein